jgi:hypothetical protein
MKQSKFYTWEEDLLRLTIYELDIFKNNICVSSRNRIVIFGSLNRLNTIIYTI